MITGSRHEKFTWVTGRLVEPLGVAVGKTVTVALGDALGDGDGFDARAVELPHAVATSSTIATR